MYDWNHTVKLKKWLWTTKLGKWSVCKQGPLNWVFLSVFFIKLVTKTRWSSLRIVHIVSKKHSPCDICYISTILLIAHYNIWISKAICDIKYSHFKRSSATCVINFYCSHILFCNPLTHILLPKTIFSLSKLAPMYSKMHLHMTARLSFH